MILAAVSDGTNRLRHVATEGIQARVAARRETFEEACIALMQREVGLGRDAGADGCAATMAGGLAVP
ncbi:hypothetical protein [Falsiroseomonas sp. E2-1-a20]|uniref:hypothetical protein n=1 Tax=Falsiroseomonas sp. E2-1-a20 TaxID=3239300 RepID=UPI003F373BFD